MCAKPESWPWELGYKYENNLSDISHDYACVMVSIT